jgi:radical SAM-linked protein
LRYHWGAIDVAERGFRLRINFCKRGRLRFLSHLELVRALERMVRRAQLPYAVSRGYNTHMRYAPGPALPVGTSGLDEYFDVWLTEYLESGAALRRLQEVCVEGLDVIGTAYADPRAKGLQATHVHEVYEMVLEVEELSAADVAARLAEVIAVGSLTVARKKKQKTYDLTQLIEQIPEVRALPGVTRGNGARDDAALPAQFAITLKLRAGEQGSIRPEVLLRAALEDAPTWRLLTITRTHLYEDAQTDV